tara:strand:- start:393 stop:1037 length:645 start_codon:yes stop_codon:yes gene_type:complete
MDINIIKPDNLHYQTIIILHGLNQDISDITYIVNKIKKRKVGIKFIIPVAHKMDISWPSGVQKNCSSWYNYFTRYDNLKKHDIINLVEFENATQQIIELVKKESKIIDPRFITLIGISQGGTVCINAALRLNICLKSIKCIDTIFLHTYHSHHICKKQNFQILQSEKDEIYNPLFQDYCYDLLKSYGHDVTIFHRDSHHCEDLDSIFLFILKNY